MKTPILILLASFSIYGCSVNLNKEQKLIKEAENYLKESLNDPYSYKRESIVIIDTITGLDLIKEENKVDLETLRSNIA
jgi:hypothetical protein